jgi:hypothetical protein
MMPVLDAFLGAGSCASAAGVIATGKDAVEEEKGDESVKLDSSALDCVSDVDTSVVDAVGVSNPLSSDTALDTIAVLVVAPTSPVLLRFVLG